MKRVISSLFFSTLLLNHASADVVWDYCSADKKPILSGINVSVAGGQERVWAAPSTNTVDGPIPDGTVSAYKDSQGKVSLLIPHMSTYRITGGSLDNLNPNSTELIFKSAKEIDEKNHNYAHWLFAPYSTDGVHFVGINHHEWYACLLNNDCNQQNTYASWFNSLTKVVSNNGGNTWSIPSNHVIVSPPPWNKKPYANGPQNNRGVFHPSKMVREGNFYYLMAGAATSVDDVPAAQGYVGMILLRTADFINWQYWVGGSNYANVGSGRPAVVPGMDTVLASLSYNASLCAYMAIFTVGNTGRGPQVVKYSLTPSMANPQWTEPKDIEGTRQMSIANNLFGAGFLVNNYPTILDPKSAGYSFEVAGTNPYLYFNTYEQNAFIRSIYRVPLKIEKAPEAPPAKISAGLFKVGAGIYYSNGSAYCYFPSMAFYTARTGKKDAQGVPEFTAMPQGMKNDGSCQ